MARRSAMAGVGVGLGLAAAGAAAAAGGLAARRRSLESLPYDGTGPFAHRPDKVMQVRASDGVDLHVEIDEPEGVTPDRPTVVLSHGFTLSLVGWVLQRKALIKAGYRIVTWDQRSHGMSGRSDAEHCTIEQIGDDLAAVIAAAAPEGPLVLVGHSMGGMTTVSFCGRHPEIVRERVLAIALLGTSIGGEGLVTLGMGPALDILLLRFGPGLLVNIGARQRLWDGLRKAGRSVEAAMVKHYGFGPDAPPAIIRLSADMIFSTRLDAVAAFMPHLHALDLVDEAVAIHGVEVLVMNGDQDEITPPQHSRYIVQHLPHAEHELLPETGHMLQLEQPARVNQQLLDLIDRGMRAGLPHPRTGATA
ncbi:alpha/beta fold hydrolase [Janibacter sp. G56]|uniref:alpha/beta fold hydrolase n=1 Tax=Janibacter sp. G56 TaxID=3418717 RepID=UPI003CFC3383